MRALTLCCPKLAALTFHTSFLPSHHHLLAGLLHPGNGSDVGPQLQEVEGSDQRRESFFVVPPLQGNADTGTSAAAQQQQQLSQAPTLSMWHDDKEEEEGHQELHDLISLLAPSGAAHHDGIATPQQHGHHGLLGLLPGPPSSASSGDCSTVQFRHFASRPAVP